MAETIDYVGPQYWQRTIYDDGHMYIQNNRSNYVYVRNSKGEWSGTGATVSGDGANLTAGAGNDSIDNYGANCNINAGAGDDYIYNSSGADSVTILGGGDND